MPSREMNDKLSPSTLSTILSFMGIVVLLVALLQSSSLVANGRILVPESVPSRQQGRAMVHPEVMSFLANVNVTTPSVLNSTAVALPAFKLDRLKPVLLEIGVLVLFQAVGFPVISKLTGMIFAVRRFRLLKALSPKNLRLLRAGGSRIWKGLLAGYSKSSASKIVNRSKKIIKVFLRHDDDDQEHHRP